MDRFRAGVNSLKVGIKTKECLQDAGIQYLKVDLDQSGELEALDIFANEMMRKS
jgi:hypothetical protein